jgi:sec-independent protein translocase protein TatB
MDFFGIGPLEILVIAILAFLFFGPEKLPGIAAKAGQYYRKFTRAAADVTRTINAEIAEEERDRAAQKSSASLNQYTATSADNNPSPSQPKDSDSRPND